MIKFRLQCDENHLFDSWFQSADAFESLQAASMLNCNSCGSTKITKAVMAPQVRASHGASSGSDSRGSEMHALTVPASPAEAAITELKNKIQQHSEYVGDNFAAEARAIHDGDAPERSIYGEANSDDAQKLIKDGVPVAPLPFLPTRKTN